MIKFREDLEYPQGRYDMNVKIPQYKSFILAYLFIFLFLPTIAQEKFYYHLIWGLESLPTKLVLQYAIATVFLSAIILFELLRIKNVKIEKRYRYLIFLMGIATYIILPFLIQGIIIFYVIHFILIFSVMLMIDEMFITLPQFINETAQPADDNERTLKASVNKFDILVFGSLFWFMILFVLIFTPPVTIVVDTYNLMEKAGIIGITELKWSPAFWTLFYIPSIYIFLALPLTIFCLIYGLIITISTPAEV